jgi:hypothetical protein
MVSGSVAVFLPDDRTNRSLVAADDGFEPAAQSADPVQELRDKDNVCRHTLPVGRP